MHLQRFAATGLQAFDSPLFSSNPGSVTNQGFSHSYGANVRAGIFLEPAHWLALGASAQSRANMSAFDEYKGLFAENGGFDIPRTWAAGLSVKPTPKIRVAYERQGIYYNEIKSVGNTFDVNRILLNGERLGTVNGPGFAWQNMYVHKVGVEYKPFKRLELRAGYSTTKQPVPENQTLINILAPGVIEKHYTFGGSYALSASSDLNVGYTYAPRKDVKGRNSIPTVPFLGGEADIFLKERILSVGYSRKL